MTDEEVVKTLTEAMEAMHTKKFEPLPEYFFVVNRKSSFHYVLRHNYCVVGTKLIVGPWMLNGKWKRFHADLTDSFEDEDLSYAEFFETRNAALRAIARNRKHYERKEKPNSDIAWVNGCKMMYFPHGDSFETMTAIDVAKEKFSSKLLEEMRI